MSTEVKPTTPAQKRPTGSRLKWLLVAAAILSLGAFLSLPYPLSPDTSATPIVPIAGLPNFHQVHSYLLRGAAPNFDGLKRLKEMGVDTVIDFRRTPQSIKLESLECQVLGLKYVSLPMTAFAPPSKQTLEIFSQNIKQARDKGGKVFIHCAHGSDRTGYMTAYWRLSNDRWPLGPTVAEMLKYGFLIHQLRLPKWG